MGMLKNPQHEHPIPCPAHPILGTRQPAIVHGNVQVR